MNWRERFLQITLFVMLFWAMNVVVSWGLSYFFPATRETTSQGQQTSAVAGGQYQVATVAEIQQPLNREIDFLDSDEKDWPAEVRTVLSGPQLQYDFSSYGGGLQRAVYSHRIEERVEDMEFVRAQGLTQREEVPFFVALESPSPYFYEKGFDEAGATFIASTPRARITKRFLTNRETARIELELTVEPLAGSTVRPRLFVTAPNLFDGGDWDTFPGFVMGSNHKIQKVYSKKIANSVWAQPEIVGVQDRYFACALIDDVNKFARRGYFWKTPVGRPGFILEGPAVEQKTSWRLSFYCGPKETYALAAADTRLESLMEYGWFARISQGMLWLLNLLNHHVGNYGWAIVLLTLLLNLLIAPFSIKTILSEDTIAAKQREYQRKQAAIRRRYADDPEQMRMAQMELLREQGLGGMSGTSMLPFLIQMPFFIALNRVLANAIQLYRAPFILWISDLSQPDPFLPWVLMTLMLTMMLVALTKGKKKIQPTAVIIVLFMGLFFGGIGFRLSTGLNLFIIVGLFFRLVLSFVVKKVQKLWMVSHR